MSSYRLHGSLLDDSEDQFEENVLGDVAREVLRSPQRQRVALSGPQQNHNHENQWQNEPESSRAAEARKRKARETETVQTPSRRSRRIAGFDSQNEEALSQDPDGNAAGNATEEQAADAGTPARAKTMDDYRRGMDRVRQIEESVYSSASDLVHAQKLRQRLEEALARGDFGEPEALQGVRAGAANEPRGRQAGQRHEPDPAPRGRVASVPQEGRSEASNEVNVSNGAGNLNTRERVHYREIQQKMKQLSRDLKHSREDCREKDKIITKLQAQLADLVAKQEVAELFAPKRLAEARRLINKTMLFGLEWWASLYPSDDTLMACYIAALELNDKEDITAFKRKWHDDHGKHAMKLLRNERQQLAAKFVGFVLREIGCPKLPSKPRPSATAVAERLAKMAPYSQSKSWLHGDGRNRKKLDGEIFFRAAYQVIHGDGAVPGPGAKLYMRADSCGLFITGVELELKGLQFDARNVEGDRGRVAAHARDLQELARAKKLTERFVLLEMRPKPSGRLKINDYRIWKEDQLEEDCEQYERGIDEDESADDGSENEGNEGNQGQ